MAIDKALDNILDAGSKVQIIRLFVCRRGDFTATGREIARQVGITAPAAHAALKELYNQNVLKRDIIGRQHLYKLNGQNRIVRNILIPAFKSELAVKDEIRDFLVKKVKQKKLQNKIISVIIYGSIQKGSDNEKSDVDVAIIVKTDKNKQSLEKLFVEELSSQFSDYFGVHLDVYIKTRKEFISRMQKNLPPVSTLLKSYSVIYGKDPIELK